MKGRDRDPIWDQLEREPPRRAVVDGCEITRGSRVRIRPRAGGDLLDSVLAGKVGRVEGIDEDDEGNLHVAVVIDDDPGRDLGAGRYPAHRFFFSASELEPIADERPAWRLLVAGIGNVFLGDDGFGVAVARRLVEHDLPPGVEVADFGIRGMDLLYALGGGWDAVILVDALPLPEEAGTVAVLDPELPAPGGAVLDAHALDPFAVLRSARQLGAVPEQALVVGCVPARVPDVDGGEDMSMELSEPVAAAVAVAAELVAELARGFAESGSFIAEGEADPPPVEA